MTSKKKRPEYFILNPLVSPKKLTKYLFGVDLNNSFSRAQYFPDSIHGKKKVTDYEINDFLKKFYHNWGDPE